MDIRAMRSLCLLVCMHALY